MKKLILAIALAPLWIHAQEVKIDGSVPAQEGTTTIQIKKTTGVEGSAVDDRTWEITEGSVDVTGETQAMNKEARASWKKACDDWKSEFRNDNKENKILSLNCGLPQCAGETAQKTCASKATYKIKTKIK